MEFVLVGDIDRSNVTWKIKWGAKNSRFQKIQELSLLKNYTQQISGKRRRIQLNIDDSFIGFYMDISATVENFIGLNTTASKTVFRSNKNEMMVKIDPPILRISNFEPVIARG